MKKQSSKPKKGMTIDGVAHMVARGFENTVTKQDFAELKNDIKNIEKRLQDIDYRLGRIEVNHERRLDILEDKIRLFETIFEKNLKIKIPK